MADVIQINDVVMIRPEYRNNLLNVSYNVMHYRLDAVAVAGGGLFPGESAAALLPLVNQAFGVGVMPAWAVAASEQVVCTGISSQAVFPAPRSAMVTTTFGTPITGSQPGDCLPMQDSPTLLKKTAFGQRWGIGRLFFAGLAEADQEDGIVTDPAVARLNGFALELKDNLTFVSGIYTYTFKPVLYTPPTVAMPAGRITPVTNIFLSNNIIKTQRRRRPGNGI